MKTKKLLKRTSHNRKIYCLLLASCILLASCRKGADDSAPDLTQILQNPAATSQALSSPVPTPTPKPTPTNAPTLNPTPPPEPTKIPEPTPVWGWFSDDEEEDELAKKLLVEIRDAVNTLDYNADEDAYPQLFARFQGNFSSPNLYYHIDLIALDPSWSNIVIHIRTRSSSYKFEGETLTDHYYYKRNLDLGDAYNIFNIVDLNNDGYDDFILDIGLDGVLNYSALFFLFHQETGTFEPLRDFSNATYDRETGIIYEYWHNGNGIDFRYKYRVEGNELILLESLCDEKDPDKPGEKYFTWKRYENGEEILVREHAPGKEIDLEEWPYPDYDRRVK